MSFDETEELDAQFEQISLVELLTWAYDRIEASSSGLSEALASSRWEEFGRIAERLAEVGEPAWRESDEAECLRGFCVADQLAEPDDGYEGIASRTWALVMRAYGSWPWS